MATLFGNAGAAVVGAKLGLVKGIAVATIVVGAAPSDPLAKARGSMSTSSHPLVPRRATLSASVLKALRLVPRTV